MNLPGMNPENNLPGYDIARMTGYGAPDFDFKALGAAMDCTGSFIRLASSMQMAHSVILFGLVSVILMVKVVSLHI